MLSIILVISLALHTWRSVLPSNPSSLNQPLSTYPLPQLSQTLGLAVLLAMLGLLSDLDVQCASCQSLRATDKYSHVVGALFVAIYLRRTFTCTLDLPRHLEPAQLNLYEPASSNRNAAYPQHMQAARLTTPT